jgi:hypothetical protein
MQLCKTRCLALLSTVQKGICNQPKTDHGVGCRHFENGYILTSPLAAVFGDDHRTSAVVFFALAVLNSCS